VLQVVAGALVEGNEEDEDDAAAGNAGSWIKVELMLEEVRPRVWPAAEGLAVFESSGDFNIRL
jgi:hypothetical protein